jgi:hypothetical protein
MLNHKVANRIPISTLMRYPMPGKSMSGRHSVLGLLEFAPFQRCVSIAHYRLSYWDMSTLLFQKASRLRLTVVQAMMSVMALYQW